MMKTCLALSLWLLLCLVLAEDQSRERIVFVGDSITDGFTYPQLIRQALAEKGGPVPVCIDAGVAGDTAADMRKRLDRDVLAHRPTLVTLSAGINDVLRKVSPADYETDVAAIAERLRAEKIPLILLTTTILGPKHAEADKKLDEFNGALRRVAKRCGLKVAEVNRRMREERTAGQKLLEPDQVHLSWEGYRVMTRAVLDALGREDVAVPESLKLEPMPGLICTWKFRPAPKGPALDEKAVTAIEPDDGWKTYTLPEEEPQDHWWQDHERRRGFAMGLARKLGPAGSYQGIAYLNPDGPRTVYFNTGAQLNAVWLNGKRIFHNESWTGWHAGKERIRAELRAGRNTVVIETGGQFFLSVTDDNRW